MRASLVCIIKIYQATLSPTSGVFRFVYGGPLLSLLPPSMVGCRHSPHCSEYAVRTLKEERDLRVALRKVGTRLLSCHPFFKPHHI